MAAQSVIPPISPDHPAIRDLRHAVELMDCLSQEGFGQIAAIARCAEVYIGHATDPLRQDILATVLRAIQGRADDIQNSINLQAEDVGCSWPSAPVDTVAMKEV